MEETVARSKRFLKDFINERTASEEYVQFGIIGNYSLKPPDVEGEVTDWVLHYLEQRKCPYQLAAFLAVTISRQLRASAYERASQLDKDDMPEDFTFQNAATLHSEAINNLHELCRRYLDNPNQIDMSEIITPLPYTVSVFAIRNKRRKMEDRHVVFHNLNEVCHLENAPPHSYYAVLDGHAGIDTANYAAAHLHTNIVRHPLFLTDTVAAIKEAFKLTDEQFHERAVRENIKSGCTVVIALIREKTIYLAWLGDSQALLVKQGTPITIMNPHKPEREDERERIEKLGGFVCHMGTWRVNGTLAVSRALGDPEHKPCISSEPDVNVIALDGTEDFLILACDGLWDFLTPSDATFLLYRHLADNPLDNPQDTIAEKLVLQSKIQGSDDNISTIVIFLRDVHSLINDAPKHVSVSSRLEGVPADSMQVLNGKADSNYPVLTPNESEQNFSVLNEFSDFGSSSTDYTSIKSDTAKNNSPQRPQTLQNVAGFQSLNVGYAECSSNFNESSASKYGLATGLAPEATALSELPTPPIDDVIASQQFSEEQLQQFESHLQTQGFLGVGFEESACSNPFISELDHQTEVEQTPQTNPFEEKCESISTEQLQQTSEFSTCVESESINNQLLHKLTPDEAVNIASDIVTSTIETAVKHVNNSSNVTDNPEVLNVCSPQKLNPYAEPFVMINFSPTDAEESDSNCNEKTSDVVSESSNPVIDSKTELFPSYNDDLVLNESNTLIQDPFGSIIDYAQPNETALDSTLLMTSELITLSEAGIVSHSEKNRSGPSNPFQPDPFDSTLELAVESELFSAETENSKLSKSPTTVQQQSSTNSLQNEALQQPEQDSKNPCNETQLEAILQTESVKQHVSLMNEAEKREAFLMPMESGTKEQLQDLVAKCTDAEALEMNVKSKFEHKAPELDNLFATELDKTIELETTNTVEFKGEELLNILENASKQTIIGDNTLPKEVKEELFKETVVSAPLEAVVPEDSLVAAIAVDLQTIPDGVPEAEGVTEDVDSDSEKDGGWSYVKTTDDTGDKAVVNQKSDTKLKKPADKKTLMSQVNTKRDLTKSKDPSNKIKIASTTDKTRKPQIEKKVSDPKDKSVKSVPLHSTATKQVTAAKTKAPSTTKTLPPKTNVESSTISKGAAPGTCRTPRPLAPKSQISTSKVLSKTSIPLGQVKSVPPKSSMPNVGPTKPLSRPTSAVASRSKDLSSCPSNKPNGANATQKVQHRPASAPLTRRTFPSTTSKITTTSKTTSSTTSKTISSTTTKTTSLGTNTAVGSTEAKSKTTTSVLKKSLPLVRKDVKEAKDSANKEIHASKSVSTTARKIPFSSNNPKSNTQLKKVITNSTSKASTLPSSRIGKSTTSAKSTNLKDATKNTVSKTTKTTPRAEKSVKETANEDLNIISNKPVPSAPKCNQENSMQVDTPCSEPEEKFLLEANTRETETEKQNCSSYAEDGTHTNEIMVETNLDKELLQTGDFSVEESGSNSNL